MNTIRNTLFFALLLLLGCANANEKNKENKTTVAPSPASKPYQIDLPKTGENKLNVSEFADTVLYIPLETNSKSLLGGIQGIQILKENILITGNDRLLLFSKNGKFIRQIGRRGNGPGECNYVIDFAAVRDTVFISPSNKKTLLVYLLDGTFLREQSLPDNFSMSWFDVTPAKQFISYKLLRSGKLCVLDRNLTKIDTIIINRNAPENPPPTMNWEKFDYCLENGSEKRILFTDYMNDTIWDLSRGKKEVGFILNMGDKLLPEKYRFERFGFDHESWMKAAAPYQKIKMVQTSKFLFLFQKKWVEENILNTIYIYDINKSMIAKYETPYIFDDLVSKQNLVPLYSSDNCIMAVLNPFELKEKLRNKKVDQGETAPSLAWLEQMKKVKENDNQILVIMPVRNKK